MATFTTTLRMFVHPVQRANTRTPAHLQISVDPAGKAKPQLVLGPYNPQIVNVSNIIIWDHMEHRLSMTILLTFPISTRITNIVIRDHMEHKLSMQLMTILVTFPISMRITNMYRKDNFNIFGSSP